MQKRYVPFAVFLLVLAVALFAHFCGRTLAAPVWAYGEGEKTVYLTFDDGPSTVVTGRILDTLREKDVKATFFLVGERIEGREETLRRIASEGHTLGVHSMSHRYDRIYASVDALLEDAAACAEAIRTVTGVTPRVYRFPGGGKHATMAERLRAQGYEIVGWNAVCGDEEIPHASAGTLLKTSLETAEGKDEVILLLHDSAPHKATAEALPAIIDAFRARGYRFLAF